MSSIWKRIINDFRINSFEEIAYFNVDIGVWRVSVSHRHKTVGSFYSIKITIWNFGNFTDPTQATSRLVIDLESRIQKSDTGDNSFVKWKGTVWSDRPVKVDHLQSWSRKFWSDQTEMVRSIWCTNRNVRNFGLDGKRPGLHGLVLSCSLTTRLFCEAAACFIGHYDVARKSGSESVPLCVFMSNEQISPPRVVCEQLSLHLLSLCMRILFKSIGHFRIPRTLTFKMRLSAQPFLWKWVLFAWE